MVRSRAVGVTRTAYTYDDSKDNRPHMLDKTTGARVSTYSYDSSGR
ncbi:hypothetical protein ACIQVT_00045 [Streptomyces sp. NPDC100445]